MTSTLYTVICVGVIALLLLILGLLIYYYCFRYIAESSQCSILYWCIGEKLVPNHLLGLVLGPSWQSIIHKSACFTLGHLPDRSTDNLGRNPLDKQEPLQTFSSCLCRVGCVCWEGFLGIGASEHVLLYIVCAKGLDPATFPPTY